MTPEELVGVIVAFKGDSQDIRVTFDFDSDGLWRVNWIGRGTTHLLLSTACQEFADALIGELTAEVEEAATDLTAKQARLAAAAPKSKPKVP